MKTYYNKTSSRRTAFTLAELLLALSVMTVVLGAAATFAFAISSAESSTNEMGAEQARIRFATMRIRELARNSSMVFAYSDTGVIFWKGDANGDGQINGNEIAWLYTNRGSGTGTNLEIMEFTDITDVEAKRDLQFNGAVEYLMFRSNETVTTLFENCYSVSITLQDNVTTVSFTVLEDQVMKDLQISAAIRGSADYLLTSESSNLVVGDDDL